MARALVTDDGVVEFRETDLVRLVTPDLADQIAASLDPDAVYFVRLIGPTKLQQVRRKYVRTQFNPKTHAREDAPLSAEEAQAMGAELLDAVLADWRGVVEAKTGAPLPCTPEVRAKLPVPVATALVYVATTKLTPSREETEASFRGAAGVAGVVEG